MRQLAVYEREQEPNVEALHEEALGLRFHEVFAHESGDSFIRKTMLQA